MLTGVLDGTADAAANECGSGEVQRVGDVLDVVGHLALKAQRHCEWMLFGFRHGLLDGHQAIPFDAPGYLCGRWSRWFQWHPEGQRSCDLESKQPVAKAATGTS